MKPQDIKLSDWMRILFGSAPAGFYIELIIRAGFIFFLLVVSMRLFGKRMAAQVNRIEMIAIFSLAAAIGVPLQAPDRGLLPALVIALVVILVGRIVTRIAFRNQKFESIVEDDFSMIVENGVVRVKDMLETRLTIERMFAQLRSEGIKHLGEVQRLYFEANGSFSLVKYDQPKPGLSIIPEYDEELKKEQQQKNEKVCSFCGKVQEPEKEPEGKCSNCKTDKWVKAIL